MVIGNNLRSRSSWWLETRAGVEGSARELGTEEGWVLEPTGSELVALHLGAAFLELRSNDNTTVLMSTRVPQVCYSELTTVLLNGNKKNTLNLRRI